MFAECPQIAPGIKINPGIEIDHKGQKITDGSNMGRIWSARAVFIFMGW